MAGLAAAIAAARRGASTLLVEQAGWLGGMGITGATGLHSFFNVFDANPARGAARRRRHRPGIGRSRAQPAEGSGTCAWSAAATLSA